MKLREGSLKHIIYQHLRSRPGVKINGGEIERLAQANGYKAETGDRRARELASEGRVVERTGRKVGYVLSEEKPGKEIASIWFWYNQSTYEIIHQQRQQETLFAD